MSFANTVKTSSSHIEFYTYSGNSLEPISSKFYDDLLINFSLCTKVMTVGQIDGQISYLYRPPTYRV